MMQPITYRQGIYAIDADYVRPNLAAIHLIVERGRAAFVDTGCNHSLPNAISALKSVGLTENEVDYVILTHIHLDHAGGAGAMMRAFPNATLVVHPRGARHMASPEKLIAGTIAVYGAEATEKLYGTILPIDGTRIVEAKDGHVIDFAGRPLLCIDTPGHARHHICIFDERSGGLFTGDMFGLSYRELDTDGRQFIFPTTTPIQFDPPAMHASLDRLMGYQPKLAYLTHFGELRDLPPKIADLHRLVDDHVEIALRHRDAGEARQHLIRADLEKLLFAELERFGCRLSQRELAAIFANDAELNAQGLSVWLESQASAQAAK